MTIPPPEQTANAYYSQHQRHHPHQRRFPRQASSLREVLSAYSWRSLGSHSKCAIAPKPELSAFVNAEREMHTHDGRSKHMHQSLHALQAHESRDLDPSYLSSHDERTRTAANSIRSPWQSMGTKPYLARLDWPVAEWGAAIALPRLPFRHQPPDSKVSLLSVALVLLCSCRRLCSCWS